MHAESILDNQEIQSANCVQALISGLRDCTRLNGDPGITEIVNI